MTDTDTSADGTMTQTPIASVPDMRARLSYLPRDIQREVCRLWNQGHMSAAIELVEKKAAR
jgi:hypothetical protein